MTRNEIRVNRLDLVRINAVMTESNLYVSRVYHFLVVIKTNRNENQMCKNGQVIKKIIADIFHSHFFRQLSVHVV